MLNERQQGSFTRREFLKGLALVISELITRSLLGIKTNRVNRKDGKEKGDLITFFNTVALKEILKDPKRVEVLNAMAANSLSDLQKDTHAPIKPVFADNKLNFYEPTNGIKPATLLFSIDLELFGRGSLEPENIKLAVDTNGHLSLVFSYRQEHTLRDQPQTVVLKISSGAYKIIPHNCLTAIGGNNSSVLFLDQPGTLEGWRDGNMGADPDISLNVSDSLYSDMSGNLYRLVERITRQKKYSGASYQIVFPSLTHDQNLCLSPNRSTFAVRVQILVLAYDQFDQEQTISLEGVALIRQKVDHDQFTINECDVVTHFDPAPNTLPKKTDRTELLGVMPDGSFVVTFLDSIGIVKFDNTSRAEIVYLSCEQISNADGKLILRSDGLWQETGERKTRVFTLDQLTTAEKLAPNLRYALIGGVWVLSPMPADQSQPELPQIDPEEPINSWAIQA